MKGRSKEARRLRLAAGRCPRHGLGLRVAEVTPEIVRFRCPRRRCREKLLVPAAWAAITQVDGEWRLTA